MAPEISKKDPSSANEAPERTIRFVIEFDGTAYRGWQRQKNGPSIQQILEEKIAVITGAPAKVIGSGRTDAGVHALGQVAHFKTRSPLAPYRLLAGLNSLLPADIAIRHLEEAPPDFHARIDVTGKTYLYRIYNGPTRSALSRHSAWAVHAPLDVEAMRAAAANLLGRHDFTSFSTVHTDVKTFVRTLKRLDIFREGDFVLIEAEADGFLRYMVRTLVGTLVEVGKGKRTPADMADILQAKNRDRAGMTAPPQGLFLKAVYYDPPVADQVHNQGVLKT